MLSYRKTLLTLALSLLLATTLGAAPATTSPAAEPEAAATLIVDSRPADLFGVSVLNAARDCGATAKPGSVAGIDPWNTCGGCSIDICDGAAVNSICGYSGGQLLRCQDWLGSLCPRQDGVRCRCSNAPIP